MRWVMRRYGWILVIVLSVMNCGGGVWEDRTSNTYWSSTGASYVGSEWVGNGNFELQKIGGWTVTYRPTKIRLTFTGPAVLSYMMVLDAGDTELNLVDTNITSLQEVAIDPALIIDTIFVFVISEVHISKIEFFMNYQVSGSVITSGVSR
jgi:hypothetical protein